MNKSIFKELKYNVIDSGNKLNLFIGINVVVFLILRLTGVFEFIFRTESGIAEWLTLQLSMPAYLPNLVKKIWTPVTYMFAHYEFFHLLFNMLWLYWMGKIFTEYLNNRQFIFAYLAGGLAGALLFGLAFNFLPAFKDSVDIAGPLIGASASVMAIVVATATLLPEYAISLLFIGAVRLKYVALAYIVLDIIGILGNPGGSFAHLGGALLGFIYIKQLQSGNDWSKLFQKRKHLKVVKNNSNSTAKNPAIQLPNQEIIDRILDKISKSGYESLSKHEKEQLFNASKKS